MQIPDLSPGTVYLFRVQAQGSDGSPGGSVVEEVFETSSEGTEETRSKTMRRVILKTRKVENLSRVLCPWCFPEPLSQNPTAIILICIGVGAILLLVVALGLCLRRRSVSSALSVCLSVCRAKAPPTTASLRSFLPVPSCGRLRMASAFTPPRCRLSFPLPVHECPPCHSLEGRISLECTLSLLNAQVLGPFFFPLSVFERKSVPAFVFFFFLFSPDCRSVPCVFRPPATL